MALEFPPSPFGTSPNHRDIRIFTKLNLTVEQALGLWSDAQGAIIFSCSYTQKP